MKRLTLTVDLPKGCYRIVTYNTAADFAPIAGRAAARLVWGMQKTMQKTMQEIMQKTMQKIVESLFTWQVKGVSYA